MVISCRLTPYWLSPPALAEEDPEDSGRLPLAVPMVAGAVVINGGTARASIRAEAVGLVLLILALLLGLAHVGGTQGNLTEMTWGGEMGQRENRVPLCPWWDQSHFLHMTCSLPTNLSFSGFLLPQDTV